MTLRTSAFLIRTAARCGLAAAIALGASLPAESQAADEGNEQERERAKAAEGSCEPPPLELRGNVDQALRWFAAHQLPSGAWSYDHGKAPAHRGPVNHAGTHRSQTGATGLAVLCFLGAGRTHREGEHREALAGALKFLRESMKAGPDGEGDLRGEDGCIVDQALATAALGEAFNLTQDMKLRDPLRKAVRFIERRQEENGGWQLSSDEPCDVRDALCQVAALKSAWLARLPVEPKTVARATQFLDGLATKGGAAYGFTAPDDLPAATAPALLARAYLGWKGNGHPMAGAATKIRVLGFVPGDACFSLSAAVLVRTQSGPPWTRWHQSARDALETPQVAVGCFEEECGSWAPTDLGLIGSKGGRFAQTAVNVLTLEVYYRRLPLLQEYAVESGFAAPAAKAELPAKP